MAVRIFPTTKPTIIPDSQKLDEENWPWYEPESFYPVNIGEILCSRYQVLYKIGYGTSSTVWICRDLSQNQYVCMKAMVQDYPSAVRELKAYELLSAEAKTTKSCGTIFVRKLLDHFQLRHGGHDYSFLIHEPLGHNMEVVLNCVGGRYPLKGLGSLCKNFLCALEFIHSAGVIHADIQPKNILSTLGNDSVLRKWEKEEIANPSPRKYKGGRTIFATKKFTGELMDWLTPKSTPTLCDFGEAHSGQVSYEWEYILPAEYRAPELFLQMKWGSAVDIWSLGCMLWQFATGEDLFRRPRTRKQVDVLNADAFQLATTDKLLGAPPRAFLNESKGLSKIFFDEEGRPMRKVPDQTLQDRFNSAFEDDERPTTKESDDFIGFIRRVLIWDPKERPSASQLLKDPWVMASTRMAR